MEWREEEAEEEGSLYIYPDSVSDTLPLQTISVASKHEIDASPFRTAHTATHYPVKREK